MQEHGLYIATSVSLYLLLMSNLTLLRKVYILELTFPPSPLCFWSDWHLSSGLATVLIEAPDLIASEIKTPSYIQEQCQMMGLPTSGNAGGLQSVSPNKSQGIVVLTLTIFLT